MCNVCIYHLIAPLPPAYPCRVMCYMSHNRDNKDLGPRLVPGRDYRDIRDTRLNSHH